MARLCEKRVLMLLYLFLYGNILQDQHGPNNGTLCCAQWGAGTGYWHPRLIRAYNDCLDSLERLPAERTNQCKRPEKTGAFCSGRREKFMSQLTKEGLFIHTQQLSCERIDIANASRVG